jgi:eukaryotic-like serine/threonine-protein kinase
MRLGGGGMAEVHLARMNGTSWVALKRIRAELRGDAEFQVRFEREASIYRLLTHPNIVQLHTWGVDRDGLYMALEYVFGRSAAALSKAAVARGRQLPLEVVLSIAVDAGAALGHAHGVQNSELGVFGVVHRDVSPDNILVSYDGAAKLTDFGIAKVVGLTTQLTQARSIKGKFGYLAPELYDGHDADVASDVFAFGVTLYGLLCGVAPFRGSTEAELMRAAFTQKPVLPSRVRGEIPEGLARLVVQCLAQERSERPPGVEPIVEVLAAHLNPDPGVRRAAVAACVAEYFPMEADPRLTDSKSSRSSPARTRTVRRLIRKPRWVVAILGGAVAGVAALAVMTQVSLSPGSTASQAPPPQVQVPVEAKPSPPLPPPPALETVEPIPSPKVERPRRTPAAPPAQRRTSAPTPPSKAKVSSATHGTLTVRVRPWAEVFVDGDLKGQTPLEPILLSPGPHSIILINQPMNERRHFTVTVSAGQQQNLNVSLAENP